MEQYTYFRNIPGYGWVYLGTFATGSIENGEAYGVLPGDTQVKVTYTNGQPPAVEVTTIP